jgi:hypothetical protein
MPHAQNRAPTVTDRDGPAAATGPKRWLVLAVIAVCQLMIVLDRTCEVSAKA